MIYRKKKYHFNPLSLEYEEIKITKGHRSRIIMMYFLGILIIAGLSGYLLNNHLGSQEARVLEKQVDKLNREMQLLFTKGRNLSALLRNDLFHKDNQYRTILQIDTLSYSIRLAGSGGTAATEELSRHYELSYQLDHLIKGLDQQMKIQSGSFETIYQKARDYTRQQTSLPAIQPVSKNDVIMISSDFGLRSDPFLFLQQVHCGLDFVTPIGKNVYATGDGIVTFVQYSRTGYGNEIVIDHKFGFGSRYAHLHEILVKEGEVIKRGQVIGTVGQSGRATGPHLHYEVLFENKPVNPAYYFDTSLTQEEYAQIINQAKNHIN